jgi:hypothetical protein
MVIVIICELLLVPELCHSIDCSSTLREGAVEQNNEGVWERPINNLHV